MLLWCPCQMARVSACHVTDDQLGNCLGGDTHLLVCVHLLMAAMCVKNPSRKRQQFKSTHRIMYKDMGAETWSPQTLPRVWLTSIHHYLPSFTIVNHSEPLPAVGIISRTTLWWLIFAGQVSDPFAAKKRTSDHLAPRRCQAEAQGRPCAKNSARPIQPWHEEWFVYREESPAVQLVEICGHKKHQLWQFKQ